MSRRVERFWHLLLCVVKGEGRKKGGFIVQTMGSSMNGLHCQNVNGTVGFCELAREVSLLTYPKTENKKKSKTKQIDPLPPPYIDFNTIPYLTFGYPTGGRRKVLEKEAHIILCG